MCRGEIISAGKVAETGTAETGADLFFTLLKNKSVPVFRKSSEPGTLLEGQVGKALNDEGVLLDYQSRYLRGANNGMPDGLGEIDAETPRFIIEIASGKTPGKTDQLKRLLDNPTLNPDRKEVILFAPNMVKPQQVKAYEKLGIKVVHSMDQLFEYGKSKGGL